LFFFFFTRHVRRLSNQKKEGVEAQTKSAAGLLFIISGYWVARDDWGESRKSTKFLALGKTFLAVLVR